jgi:hypothetical protein
VPEGQAQRKHLEGSCCPAAAVLSGVAASGGVKSKELRVAKRRVFVSFGYDHDVDLKNALVAQSRLPDSPFDIADWSIKVASPGWRAEARRRIRASDVVVVLCGQQTHTAVGVATEVIISQEESIPYFLLRGYQDKTCHRPTTAKPTDKMYTWTWDNLKRLIGGAR